MTGHAHHAPPVAPTGDPVAPPADVKAPEVSSFKLLATLAVAGAAAGLLVVGVYKATLPTIERYSAAKVETAVREVLKNPARWDTLYLQNNALTRKPTGSNDLKDMPKAYVGYDEAGKKLGAAVTAQEPGFQEEVLLMIGFNPETSTLIGFKVVEEKETPGLGDKIERDTSFGNQFPGRVAPLKGVKARDASDPSQVQTITGATISSRAVIRIINHAVEKWQPLLAAYDKGRIEVSAVPVQVIIESTPDFVPGAPPPATVWADTWRGIASENPVLVQMLGMCPTMAVTNVLANGIAMGIATLFVLVGSGLFVSLLKKYIAHEVRITSYILIIATFVTLADLILAATFPEISKALGPFIPLIVANCLLLGRAEAFAAKVGPVRAVADGMGMGIGFTLSLSAMSAIRELLGRGSLLGIDILGPHWEPWVFMVLPPGGFFTLGLLLITAAWVDEMRRKRRLAIAK